jgi:2-aminoadipate transaminase
VRKVYAERAQTSWAQALRRELGDAIAFVQPQGGMFCLGAPDRRWRQDQANGQCTGQTRHRASLVAFVPGAPFFANNPDLVHPAPELCHRGRGED